MAEKLFTNSKVEGVVTPEAVIQPEIITIFGNTDQTIQFDFKTNTSQSATINNTTRVDYCRNLPIEKPLTVNSAEFLCFDEGCPGNQNFIQKTIGDGIELIESDGKAIGLKVSFTPEETENLPDEVGFSLILESAEYQKKVWAFGSLMIRHLPSSN